MNKLVVLIVLLIAASLLLPFLLSSCSTDEEEDNGGISLDFDYDGKHKKSRSARSLGGSRSYSSGK